MKKSIFTIFLTIIASVGILAEDVIETNSLCNDLTWSFDSKTGTLEINGSGSMLCNSWESGWPWDKYKKDIKHISLPEGLTKIAPLAFDGCAIETIDIPSSVTGILHDAFAGCDNLKSVTIPSTVSFLGMCAFTCDTIKLLATTPPETEMMCSKFIIIPCLSLQTYQTNESWKQYNFNPLPYKFEVSENVEILQAATTCDDSNTAIIYAQPSVNIWSSYDEKDKTKPSYDAELLETRVFQSWSDGNTDNPRTVTITSDTAFTAMYAKAHYVGLEVTGSAWGGEGTIQIADTNARSGYYKEGELTLTAVPNNDRSFFVEWIIEEGKSNYFGEGKEVGRTTENPLTVNVSDKEYSYFAYFDPKAIVKLEVQGEANGSVEMLKGVREVNGEYQASVLADIELVASPKEGYERNVSITSDDKLEIQELTYKEDNISFKLWPSNYFDYQVDTVFIDVTFARYYTLSVEYDDWRGYITEGESILADGHGLYPGDSEITLRANPHQGFRFVSWMDGNTENPRSIRLTQDTLFSAIFDYKLTDKCGENNALTYVLDTIKMELSISGNGALNDNYTYTGVGVQKLIFGNGITAIGSEAFYDIGLNDVKSIVFGSSLKVIERGAFDIHEKCDLVFSPEGGIESEDCKWLIESITCYSQRPPSVKEEAFGYSDLPYSTIIYVLADYRNTYKVHDFWGLYDVRPLGATSVETNEVKVTPSETSAEVVWPSVSGAVTYELIIKDLKGNVICKLEFNANGQLTGISLAPSRDNVSQQQQKAGFAFTVTGLNSGETYNYTITAKNGSGTAINTENGSFTTQSPEAIDEISTVNCQLSTKFVRDGHLFILRDGKVYNAQGARVE